MDLLNRRFSRHPSQRSVADLMLRKGFGVSDGSAVCGGVRIADSALARVAQVDRRVVRSTIEAIEADEDLKALFSNLDCMALLAGAASQLGCTAIQVVPTDASMPGIMAGVMDILYRAGVNVRQAVVSDAVDEPQSRLTVVVDGALPSSVLAAVRASRGVSSVVLLRGRSRLRTLAGFPTTTVRGSTSWVTTDPAPTVA